MPAAYADAAASRGGVAARAPDRAAADPGGRRARPGRAGLAQRQPFGPRRPRAVRRGHRSDPGDPARGRLPRADRGDRVRHPDDRRGVQRQRRAGRASSSSRAAWPRTRCSCRSTPTSPGCRCRVIDSEQGPALGSAIHAAVAAGAYPDVHAPPSDGQGATRGVPARRDRAPRPTTRCSRSTPSCTTTSAGAHTTMHRLKALRAMPRRGRRPDMTIVGRRRRRSSTLRREVVRTARRADPLRAWWPGRRATSRPACPARSDGDQAERRLVRRAHPGEHGRLRPRRPSRRGRRTHRRATPRPTRTSTARCPHVGGVVHTHSTYATAWAAPGEPDPVRAHRDGRRVRRRHPGRAVRAHRRRLDRPRHRRDAARIPLARGAHAEPRRLHDRHRRARPRSRRP